MRLSDCRAVLTGASGIGLQLAEQLCEAGAQVLAVSRHEGSLAALRQRFPNQLRWQEADLNQASGRQDVLSAAWQMGGTNLLINAAGINHFALFEQASEEGIAELLDLNVKATLQLTRLLLPLLRRQEHALITNIGSTYGSIGYPGYAAYCASKFALRGFGSPAPRAGGHGRGCPLCRAARPHRDERRCRPGAQRCPQGRHRRSRRRRHRGAGSDRAQSARALPGLAGEAVRAPEPPAAGFGRPRPAQATAIDSSPQPPGGGEIGK